MGVVKLLFCDRLIRNIIFYTLTSKVSLLAMNTRFNEKVNIWINEKAKNNMKTRYLGIKQYQQNSSYSRIMKLFSTISTASKLLIRGSYKHYIKK